MRILLVESSGRGFLSHYVHALALGLSELGHDVRLVTGRRDELASWSVPFAKSACLGRGAAAWLCLAREVSAFRPHVVHFQWVGEPLLARLFAAWSRRLGTGLVYTPHNLLPHRARWLSMPTFRGFYRAMDRVVARDRHVAWAAEEMLGASVDQLVHLPGSPNLLAHPAAPRRQVAELAPKQQGELRLLFFGHGCQRKGLGHLLASLGAREWPAVLHLVVAGEGVLRAAEPSALVRARGKARITVVDRYLDPAEVAGLFATADLLLMPYVKLCKSPLVDLALAFGLPILRSDRVETTCFVEGAHGFTVAHGDVAAFGHRLAQLVEQPGVLSALRSAVAREEPVVAAMRRLAAAHARMYGELAFAGARGPAVEAALALPSS